MTELKIKPGSEKKERRISAIVPMSTFNQMTKITEAAHISLNDLVNQALVLVLDANKDLIDEYDKKEAL